MVAVAEGQLLPYETRAADNERRTVAVEVQRARQNTGWLSKTKPSSVGVAVEVD